MELWIAAGVPSAIVAFCFWMLERRIQERAEAEKSERARRQEEQDIKEENREKLQYMMLKALDGSLSVRSYSESGTEDSGCEMQRRYAQGVGLRTGCEA